MAKRKGRKGAKRRAKSTKKGSTMPDVQDHRRGPKPRYHNPEPVGDEVTRFGISALKAEFGRRLQRAMVNKGWSQADLAREATLYLPEGQDFGRDNISNAVRKGQIPRPHRLKALCAALGVAPTDLIPRGAVGSIDKADTPLDFRVVAEGRVALKVNQVVPYDTAMKIMQLLGQADLLKKDGGG